MNAIEEKQALANATAEHDDVKAQAETLEAQLPSLHGLERANAERQLAHLRTKLVYTEATVKRFTVDRIKRLRRGLASLDEIRDRLDEVVFADGAGAVWFGFKVSAGNDPNLLEALSTAIVRLSRTDNAAAMNYARWRSSQVPHDPANRTLVW